MNHAELRMSLGAYALGALEPDEEREVEEHLVTCAACLAELDDLLAVEPALAKLVDSPVHDRPARRSRRWLLAAAACVLVLAGAGTAIGFAVSPSPSTTTRVSATAGPVTMAVTASDISSGTRLELSLQGLAQNEHCHLVARAADGSLHDAGWWNAGYEGRAMVVESTAVPRPELRELTLFGSGGRKLVTARL